MLNLPVVNDNPELNKVNVPESDVDFHYAALQHGINGIFHIEDSLELLVRGVQQVQAGNKWFSREIMSRYIDANLCLKQNPLLHFNRHILLTKRNYPSHAKLQMVPKIRRLQTHIS